MALLGGKEEKHKLVLAPSFSGAEGAPRPRLLGRRWDRGLEMPPANQRRAPLATADSNGNPR